MELADHFLLATTKATLKEKKDYVVYKRMAAVYNLPYESILENDNDAGIVTSRGKIIPIMVDLSDNDYDTLLSKCIALGAFVERHKEVDGVYEKE